MSWNKNTHYDSVNEILAKTFEEVGTPYCFSVMGNVVGHGLNDSDEKTYPITRLQYLDIVRLSQMQRTCDCDVDDVVEDFVFKKEVEPEVWPLEVNVCVCGDCQNGETADPVVSRTTA